MSLIKIDGNAKINLTLDILGKREDGYHEVAMVMQSIGLSDTIEMEKTAEVIELSINVPYLKADESNLAYKAAKLVQDTYKTGGAKIKLIKRIPIAAGLAGGSTDAAAVLKGMNELYDLKLTEDKLCELGAKLGSDIPFCIRGGTMLSTGRGEVLERVADLPEIPVVLIKPRISVSTAWAYKNYDENGAEKHPDNAAIIKYIEAKDVAMVTKSLCNVLESVTIKKHVIIDEYKQMLIKQGAMAAMMSGSGPTVFALVETMEKAKEIAAYMREHTDGYVFVTKTVSRK